MSTENQAKDTKIPRFVYTNSLFENKSENELSQNLSPSYTPTLSQDSTQVKNFGNSARFYKALKDYQQYSDANILKEELWASRKEITNLEKLLLEKTEEILELKKACPSDYSKNDSIKKSLETEKSHKKQLESENLRLKKTIDSLLTKLEDNQNLSKIKFFFDHSVKRLVIDNEDNTGKILDRLKESEFRIRKIKGFLEDKGKHYQGFEDLIKEKMGEIIDLKKEMSRLSRMAEKKVENDDKFKGLVGRIEELRRRNENLVEKISAYATESKLLNDINEELEKENVKALKIVDEQRTEIKNLRKKLLDCISKAKNIKSNEAQAQNYQKVYEKYKTYKQKLRNLLKKSEKKEKNGNIEEISKLLQEIERLNIEINQKDLKIMEFQSEIHKRELLTQALSRDIDHLKTSLKGASLEKHEKLVNENNKLNEAYEALLRSYSETQENNENGLKLSAKCVELEEKVIDLESTVVIYSAKIKKYKEILEANNLSATHSRNPSTDRSSYRDS